MPSFNIDEFSNNQLKPDIIENTNCSMLVDQFTKLYNFTGFRHYLDH